MKLKLKKNTKILLLPTINYTKSIILFTTKVIA